MRFSSQSGGTVNQLYTLHRVLEDLWEFAQPVHMRFVDLEKAFDRVPRGILWGVLQRVWGLGSFAKGCSVSVRPEQELGSHCRHEASVAPSPTTSPATSTPTVMNVSFLNELNDFYARFDKDNKEKTIKPKPSDDHQTLTLSPTDVQNALSQINARKAVGPDGIPGRVPRACAEQLAGVFTGHLQPVTCPDSSTSVFQDHLDCASAETFLSDVPE
ncbi:hypothetical protein L3Q82_005276 [Scortum barcoo]|uniref:Uncharacterized protein n=1 Tax=Scortum barcoo TaxID=214431 RepID=A0ACB8V9F3_9TELE|nr:hypothetical protein L3Q82_005276 [Scortum barcoo]